MTPPSAPAAHFGKRTRMHRGCYDNASGGREGSADISKKPPKKEAEHATPAGLHHGASPRHRASTPGPPRHVSLGCSARPPHQSPARPPNRCPAATAMPAGQPAASCGSTSARSRAAPAAPRLAQVVSARRAVGSSQGWEPCPQHGQGMGQHSITRPNPLNAPPLGHPGLEVLSGHGGAGQSQCCPPCSPLPATSHGARHACTEKPAHHSSSLTSVSNLPALAVPVSPQQ